MCNFARIAKSLTELVNKRQDFVLDRIQQQTSETMYILIFAPILGFHKFTEPFTLATDASSKVPEAVLLQRFDGMLLPIGYTS